MQPIRKPTWQQATALVSLSTCGAMTGFAFAHGSVDDMTSPTRMPVHLVSVSKPEQPAATAETTLRSAIVDVANKYLRLARNKTPAQMEAMIWGSDSVDGIDHGESCAAFASLTLELGARAAGQQSWVSGGSSYPWPLHEWADVRVDPNPDSLNVVSVLQDAQSHHRWHPLGDGYDPQPGDWVLFDGHVEVVTGYSDGVLNTIGGDSLPNFSVNAHTYTGSLSANGVDGFVNNGQLLSAVSQQPARATSQAATGSHDAQIPGLQIANAMTGSSPATSHKPAATRKRPAATAKPAAASTTESLSAVGGVGTGSMVTMPGVMTGGGTASQPASASASQTGNGRAGTSAATALIPGMPAGAVTSSTSSTSTGSVSSSASKPSSTSSSRSQAYTRNNTPASSPSPGTAQQQAFISQIAPGAMAAQSRYGVPAAVTIAQAIDESGWGQSELAARDNNLFGIKGTGPAGTDMMPTREYLNGRWVTQTSGFRVYHNIAQSISDHAELLATASSYQHAMADQHVPDAFANDLTGVYATDPSYGSSLIQIMQLYNLYRYDASTTHASVPASPAATGSSSHAKAPATASTASGATRPASASSTSAPAAALGDTAAVAVPNEGVVSQAAVSSPGAAASRDGTGQRGAAKQSSAARQSRSHGQGRTSRTGGSAGGSSVPGAASGGSATHGSSASQDGGTSTIPGIFDSYTTARGSGKTAAQPARAARVASRRSQAGAATLYRPQIPQVVTTAYISTAKAPLTRAQPLYEDVASGSGIRWELLAACDWMQCQAQPKYSPVHGEKLGTKVAGTAYHTRSEALAQCASDLVELAMAVYWIDITARRWLSVRELAQVFAAFRWGGLLKLHDISALEFPYSVAGLTAEHLKMRWPDVDEPNAPDKPGSRFRMPFGAVPAVLSLGYRALT